MAIMAVRPNSVRLLISNHQHRRSVLIHPSIGRKQDVAGSTGSGMNVSIAGPDVLPQFASHHRRPPPQNAGRCCDVMTISEGQSILSSGMGQPGAGPTWGRE